MPFQDLRAFINKLESEGELVRVKVPVDPRYEIGAVCRKVLNMGGIDHNLALLFEQPTGYTIPLATNILTSRHRYYMALETNAADFHREYIRRTDHPIPPRIVKEGPCKENILLGDQVDLLRFPIPIWNDKDGGHYITLPCQISKDWDTGVRNAGMYRMMVHSRNTTGILCGPYRSTAQACRKMHAQGKPFPIAIAIGLDPAIYAATIAPFADGLDELAMAGGLRGEPVDLVPCETIPLEVPATAEIVLEGEIPPGLEQEEGPFGEFTGYYGERARRPVIVIKAITHRNNPIYEGTYEGRPPVCDSVTQVLPHEVEIMRQVRVPGLKKIRMCVGGVFMMAVAAIEKRFGGQERTIASAILATPSGRWIKVLILVDDDDIDIDNWGDIEWAMATRFQPDTDTQIYHAMTGNILDPSMLPEEKESGACRTSKILIDATRPVHRPFAEPCLPQPEVMMRVEREWARYGIPNPRH